VVFIRKTSKTRVQEGILGASTWGTLQCVSSVKVCSRCGGSGVIKKEEEAPKEDRERE